MLINIFLTLLNIFIKTETKLSKFNKRTLSSNKFIDYLQEKRTVTKKLQDFFFI